MAATAGASLSSAAMEELEIRRFEQPDEVRSFEHGTFELVRLGGMTVGRASYEPGWKWAKHVGTGPDRKRTAGAVEPGWKWSTHVGTGPDDRCQVEHVGLVVSGRAAAAAVMDDGTEVVME